MAQHRSVSQLLKYAACSEQYRLTYVDKPQSEYRPAAWLAQGSAFHVTIQKWEESGRYEGFDLCRTFELEYDAEIEKFKARQPDLTKWLKAPRTKTEDDISNRRARGLEQVNNYVTYASSSNFAIKDIDEFNLAVEVEFEVELGGVLIKGAIDQILVDPLGVEVRDLKTGNRESSIFQIAIYTLVVEKIFGWPVVRASYYYAKDSKIVTISREELNRYSEDYLSELFQALDVGIKNNVFIPNPGSQCQLCPVKDFCREVGSTPIPLQSPKNSE